MPSFWSYIGNEKFNIGCTGQTVYVYDKNGTELAKFKDLPYAYTAAISPNNDIFVVKTTEGRLAVYSLDTLSLIKKFRFSKVDGAQDDNFCFSFDGKEFYNIERHIDSCKTAFSIYDTNDFTLKKRVLENDHNLVLTSVEYDKNTNDVYLLGFFRDKDCGVASDFFVGKLKDYDLKDLIYISEAEHEFYVSYKRLAMMGFTEKAYDWSYMDIELGKLRKSTHSLSALWKYHDSNH